MIWWHRENVIKGQEKVSGLQDDMALWGVRTACDANKTLARQGELWFRTAWLSQTLITNSGMRDWANKWEQPSAWAKQAMWSKQKWMVWANERTDKQVSQYLLPDCWLFWTTVLGVTTSREKVITRRNILTGKSGEIRLLSEHRSFPQRVQNV